MDKIPSIVTLLISIFVIISSCGCISNSSKNNVNDEVDLEWDEMTLYGMGSGSADSQPYEFEEAFVLQVENNKVTQIFVNITIEDGNEGTNPDYIDHIIFAPMGNDANTIPFEINGDYTPFIGHLEYKAKEGEFFNDNWYFSIAGVLYASDDQWPGPLIWRGIQDTGYDFTLDVRYEYIKEGDPTNL